MEPPAPGARGPGPIPAVPDAPAALREADLFALAPPALLEAARDYALLGRVRDPRMRGSLLAADVEGTNEIHAVRVTVERPEGPAPPVVKPLCSCPAHRPFCRHVLALLFLWAWEPERFGPVGAWERALAALPAAETAAVLARAAMGDADPLTLLRRAVERDWDALPPGRCLESWGAFRQAALDRAAWPAAALELAARIAGPPAAPPPADPRGVRARQLAWWLTLVADDLPPPALLPWLRHLFAHLETPSPNGRRLPAAVAVWLARLAPSLPTERWAEARWLARFAAVTPAVAGVFAAEVQRQLWEAEVTWRVAGGEPVAEALPSLRRVRLVWEAFSEAAHPVDEEGTAGS